MRNAKKLLGLGLVVIAVIAGLSLFSFARAQEAGAITKAVDPGVTKFAFIAAAIATGLSALAGGIAVAYVGAAAVGAISEKPELAGRTLIFVGLAEGIAIYGLIIAIMILGKV